MFFRRILIDHAEIVVHDGFGDQLYWKCRRSMRFAKNLVKIADEFRIQYLDSSDSKDKTERPSNWENEKVGFEDLDKLLLLNYKFKYGRLFCNYLIFDFINKDWLVNKCW